MNKKLTCHREIIDFHLFFCFFVYDHLLGEQRIKIGRDHSMKMVGMFQKLKFSLKSQVYKGFSKH